VSPLGALWSRGLRATPGSGRSGAGGSEVARRAGGPGCRPRPRAREAGSATVATLGGIGVLVMVLGAALALASAAGAAHRARAAADLGALAAASSVQATGDAGLACALGANIVARNDARQVSCAIAADGSVTVVAQRQVGLVLPGTTPARARITARAGPAP
jgi:secretion/DNA translocation related TadE-like protein